MIDFSTELGRRVARQLKLERIIWLTTVGPENTPQPRPVWFLWDGTSFLIYSQPKAHKVSHISHNSKVSLNLNADPEGDEVAVFLGVARLDSSAPAVTENAEYLEKYDKGIADLDMTPTEFGRDYSIPIRVTPTRLRGL